MQKKQCGHFLTPNCSWKDTYLFLFFFKYSIPARIIIDEMLRLDQLSNIDTRV